MSNVSFRFEGNESSRSGGNDFPTNSSWTDIVACLRQTDSSYIHQHYSSPGKRIRTHRRYSKKHNNQLLLIEHRMSNQRIRESNKASPPLLQKRRGIGCEVSAIDFRIPTVSIFRGRKRTNSSCLVTYLLASWAATAVSVGTDTASANSPPTKRNRCTVV